MHTIYTFVTKDVTSFMNVHWKNNSALKVKYDYIQTENAFKPIFVNNFSKITPSKSTKTHLELNNKFFPLKLFDFIW